MFRSTARKAAALAAGLLLALGGSAHATLVTFSFDGTIEFVEGLVSSEFSVGQAFNVTYTFDSTVGATPGSNSNFSVFNALTSLAFTSGAYSASSTAPAEIQVDNDPGAPNNDRYGLTSRASEGLTGAAINGYLLDGFSFRLDDISDSVFSDALLLPTSIDLADFSSNAFFLFFTLPGLVPTAEPQNGLPTSQLVFGSFDTLTITTDDDPVVPEPASIMLGAMGVAMLAARRRMRRA